MIRYFLFDLDNTIYPKSVGVFQRLGERITQFMVRELGISLEEAIKLRQDYLRTYGTTLQGLRTHFNIDTAYYMQDVHKLFLDDILKPNKILDAILAEINFPKMIFTNSPIIHAKNVLRHLELEHHFSKIFDIEFFDYEGKPAPQAYEKVLKELSADASACVLFDDSVANLVTAQNLGMIPVLVREEGNLDFRHHLRRLEDLPTILNDIISSSL